jgi:hypothetical protein
VSETVSLLESARLAVSLGNRVMVGTVVKEDEDDPLTIGSKAIVAEEVADRVMDCDNVTDWLSVRNGVMIAVLLIELLRELLGEDVRVLLRETSLLIETVWLAVAVVERELRRELLKENVALQLR